MIEHAIHSLMTTFFGWRTNRKLLVFESDDWGALYLPGQQQIKFLTDLGILEEHPKGYRRFDCLERRADLQTLFDLLSNFCDINGNPAKFTFNTVMGNPDFQKIREADFQMYFHQPFFDSYKFFNNEDCLDVWRSGMASKVMIPQFHAREHIDVRLWLNDLKANNIRARAAFDNNFYSLVRSTTPPRTYMAAYWATSQTHLEEIAAILLDGLDMFEGVFGFPSRSFVACKFILPSEIEKTLAARGVHTIQTQRRHRVPIPETGNSRFKRRISGTKNSYGQVYSTRNVFFEPFEQPDREIVNRALAQTERAFRCGKPAVVSSHRVNYVGRVDKTNRDRTLRQLWEYLSRALEKWPDIEFVSSDQLRPIIFGLS